MSEKEKALVNLLSDLSDIDALFQETSFWNSIS